MNAWLSKLRASPVGVRIAPFLIFYLLTIGQGRFGEEARYWFYFAKTVVGAWLIFVIWKWVKELEWRFTWEALAAGIAVFVLWVGLDPFLVELGWEGSYPKFGGGQDWNPHAQFGADSAWAWFFIVTRIAGSSLVVPVLEELFYRSFLYRYLVQPDFQKVSMKHFGWWPFLLTAVIFASTHYEWLAAMLCAFVYQGLVIWKGRLGDAITAHAITNFLLGLWVVYKGAWHFW